MHKTLTIRLSQQRLPKSRDQRNNLARKLARGLYDTTKYSHLIERKHQDYFNKWAAKFKFPIPVALYVYKRTKQRSALAYLTTLNGMAWVGLSTETLKNGDDWTNSIVHEFLHLMFILSLNSSRALTLDNEENLVIVLSDWLSKSKQGSIYTNKIFASNN